MLCCVGSGRAGGSRDVLLNLVEVEVNAPPKRCDGWSFGLDEKGQREVWMKLMADLISSRVRSTKYKEKTVCRGRAGVWVVGLEFGGVWPRQWRWR